jgi:15-cis-phytoene synthase
VTAEAPDPLPPEADLALAWSGPDLRGPLSIALQLDRRLARIVGRTHEPMLGQMRLAWWREALGKPVSDRPRGDAVLDGIGDHWQGREAALAQMVDGWEVLVTAQNLGPAEAEAFASGRGAFFAALASDSVLEPRIAAAGRRWALAEAAAGVSDPQEKSVLVAAGLAQKTPSGRMPRALRGLAVLESLARRALLRGGRPLMEGRGASLAALRGAIFRA